MSLSYGVIIKSTTKRKKEYKFDYARNNDMKNSHQNIVIMPV